MRFRVLQLSTLWLAGLLLATVAAAGSDKKTEEPSGGSAKAKPSADYILQPEDVIKVHVFQEDDINKQGEVRISGEHTIFLPLIKIISLKGKTVRQAEELIRDLYNKDYLVNPQVSINVLKYAERSLSVTGAVNNAGRILFPQERGLTIVEAISLAGGQSRVADLKRVRLTRRGAGGELGTQIVDVDSIMRGGARDAVPLENGDTLFVPERTF